MLINLNFKIKINKDLLNEIKQLKLNSKKILFIDLFEQIFI